MARANALIAIVNAGRNFICEDFDVSLRFSGDHVVAHQLPPDGFEWRGVLNVAISSRAKESGAFATLEPKTPNGPLTASESNIG